MAYDFASIEAKWQAFWRETRPFRALDPSEAAHMPKAYVLDMFPYPSGAGLHVGHPEGYTATDIYARYLRMRGYNVLHPMGWDAFGLPAEQYAIKTGQHPRITTEKNIETFRRQLDMLGFSYDWDREVNTTEPGYVRWTQWIFLQLYNSYFDPVEKRARPISHLERELENGNFLVAPDGSIHLSPTQEGMESISGGVTVERPWSDFSPREKRQIIDGQRLAYTDEVPVNWCPGLGTVLANEEVIDGKSEVGGFPVERRPMRQWMLRITAYADRLIDDLSLLQWPESLKEMQRNWIGRSEGAEIDFLVAGGEGAGARPDDVITVFTTRPDTLFGCTFMVLAPEHPLVERLTTPAQREQVQAYCQRAAARSERDRLADVKEKTGVFTGSFAINPANDREVPVWIADYVLMGYGTGAIMAVPGQDERDWEFAEKFGLPIVRTVQPPEGFEGKAYTGDGPAINSEFLNGMRMAEAKRRMIEELDREGVGRARTQYKLRDWLFSRQRYWGEPFPILLDEEGYHEPLDESELPLELPDLPDFQPTGTLQPPLSKASEDWLVVRRNGRIYRRETNTMPQWAGSCWYYLRYLDPTNNEQFVAPDKQRYWLPVDLYVGGVEHAVLHLLYARFWHKVLFDLGYLSTPEPFARLVNQGMILGEAEYHFFEDASGNPVSAADVRDMDEEVTAAGVRMFGFHRLTGEKLYAKRIAEALVEKRGEVYTLRANPAIRVDARSFKMSKSRGNVVNPDDIVRDFGADAFRLYEMYMGPLEAQKPWSTRDIIGMSRFLNSVWRNLVGSDERPAVVVDKPVPDEIARQMHQAIRKVGEDIEQLHFNTAIAELIKLNNQITPMAEVPRELAENLVLLLAPFAPHLAEEIWQRLGHGTTLARHPWPTFNEEKLKSDTVEVAVQVNGKVRDRMVVDSGAAEADVAAAALQLESVQRYALGKAPSRTRYVPGRLINLVFE
jgi:leucyl-tRNA synthetase